MPYALRCIFDGQRKRWTNRECSQFQVPASTNTRHSSLAYQPLRLFVSLVKIHRLLWNPLKKIEPIVDNTCTSLVGSDDPNRWSVENRFRSGKCCRSYGSCPYSSCSQKTCKWGVRWWQLQNTDRNRFIGRWSARHLRWIMCAKLLFSNTFHGKLQSSTLPILWASVCACVFSKWDIWDCMFVTIATNT